MVRRGRVCQFRQEGCLVAPVARQASAAACLNHDLRCGLMRSAPSMRLWAVFYWRGAANRTPRPGAPSFPPLLRGKGGKARTHLVESTSLPVIADHFLLMAHTGN